MSKRIEQLDAFVPQKVFALQQANDLVAKQLLRGDGIDIRDRDPLSLGSPYVGEDRRYYRASGTSFVAPMVTGVASLLLAKNPSLSLEQLKRVLMHSARDIETPGLDQVADLVVLSHDLFKVLPGEIAETEVMMTVMGGEVVYISPRFLPEEMRRTLSSRNRRGGR